MTEMEEKVERLEAQIKELQILKDIKDIEDLTYRYYMDLTTGRTENCTSYFSADGEFIGKTHKTYFTGETLIQYFKDLGKAHTGAEGNFLVHPVIHVNGDTATGYWTLYFFNVYQLTSMPIFMAQRFYENEYVRENGEWKIQKLVVSSGFGPNFQPPYPGCRKCDMPQLPSGMVTLGHLSGWEENND